MLSYPTPSPGGGLYVIWLSDEDEPHYYGGRTTSFKRRWRSHLRDLEAGKHDNDRMQSTFNKYGVFRPEVLVRLKPKGHVETEQEWLDTHYGKVGCVNLSPCSAGGSGGHTEATRRKMSKTRASCPVLVQKARESLAVNRCTDVETLRVNVLAAIEANTGSRQSQETKSKRAESHRGRTNTPETLALMSASAKRRAALQPPSHGDETRALISSQQKGRIWINDGQKNRRLFPEEAEGLLAQGWVRGKLGRSGSGLWAHRYVDGSLERQRIPKAELPGLLATGWSRGTGPQG